MLSSTLTSSKFLSMPFLALQRSPSGPEEALSTSLMSPAPPILTFRFTSETQTPPPPPAGMRTFLLVHAGSTRDSKRSKPHEEDPKLSKKDREKAAVAHAEREKSLGQSGVEWKDVQYGTGQLRVGIQFVENRQQSLKIEDFELLKVVGKGSFGKVMQVQYVSPQPIIFPSAALTYMTTGRRTLDGYTLSRPSEKHTSSPDPKSHTLWQNGRSSPRSITLSSCP